MKGQIVQVVRALESGIDRAIPIAEHTGIPLANVYVQLHQLKVLGVLSSSRVLKNSTGSRWPTQQRKQYLLRTKGE